VYDTPNREAGPPRLTQGMSLTLGRAAILVHHPVIGARRARHYYVGGAEHIPRGLVRVNYPAMGILNDDPTGERVGETAQPLCLQGSAAAPAPESPRSEAHPEECQNSQGNREA
jgi:hypothetical protein